MIPEKFHVLVIFGMAAISGYETSKGRYGWAVTYGLLFFAVLKY